MAGAQLPIGMLVDPDDDQPFEGVREVVTERFFEALELRPTRRSPDAFDDSRYTEADRATRPEAGREPDGA
jgi:hypothetical protein